mmetsp:Transcript_25091/g.45650  ORF Transcript_25091/g.45650 Transcript_25091/m.45650 type:complete len:240 (-) Transcript_25091:73-792(-)
MSTWQVDAAAGTLDGWGEPVASAAPAASAAPPAPDPAAVAPESGSGAADGSSAVEAASVATAPRKGGDRAEDLFADWRGEEASAESCTAIKPAAQARAEEKAEDTQKEVEEADPEIDIAGAPELEDAEAALDAITADIEKSAEELSALLQDTAAFHEACQSAIKHAAKVKAEDVPGQAVLQTAEDLQKALNYISDPLGIEALDDEEAAGLFDGPMDMGFFYQLARDYFTSLSRTLAFDS